MKRIDTATREVDKHGTGRDGFTNGVPDVTPTTALDETWFDHVQEEACTLIEGTGDTLDDTVFTQSLRAVQGVDKELFATTGRAHIMNIPTIAGTSGLQADITLPAYPGMFSFRTASGQKHTVTQAMVDADGSWPHTFTANQDTYVYVSEDAADRDAISFHFVGVANGAADPTSSQDSEWALIGKVVTDATTVTDVNYWFKYPRFGLCSAKQFGHIDQPVEKIVATRIEWGGSSSPAAPVPFGATPDMFAESSLLGPVQFTASGANDTDDTTFILGSAIPDSSVLAIELIVTAARIGADETAVIRVFAGVEKSAASLVSLAGTNENRYQGTAGAGSDIVVSGGNVVWRNTIVTDTEEWRFQALYRVHRMLTGAA